ncbi:Transcription factor Zn, C2H2 [Mycena venus]|uniref:Transcription factor Zn, C2H2 n=1 Tax=Mycena venus TaxID=2733690 RepID=A0A8H6X2F7_9AGAR|nr:Transcription factor Zn, C2H2 [Mycena venus]
MDPRLGQVDSEDEFDCLLRDDSVTEDFLLAVTLLEHQALGLCPPSQPVDEFDLMLSDDLPSDFLMACDEAERVASLPDKLLDGTISSSTNSLPSLPPPSSVPRSTPFANITKSAPNLPKNTVIQGSPISISSDSSSKSSDSSDDHHGDSSDGKEESCSTPTTSPVVVVASWSARKSFAITRSDTSKTASTSVINSIPRATLKRKAPLPSEPQPLKKRKMVKRQNHLEAFFAGYPRFRYDPTAPVSAQYHALCKSYGFLRLKNEYGIKSEPNPAREAAYAGYRRAMALTFADLFGRDVNDLGTLQNFCKVLKIDPVPQTVGLCKVAIRAVHVNLVDLVDWGRRLEATHGADICIVDLVARGQTSGRWFQKFETLEELQEYTITKHKFYPQDVVEGTLLEFLLRHIIH